MEMTQAKANAAQWPIVQPLVMLLSFPFAGLEMKWLPVSPSAFAFGMMTRLGVCFGVVVLLWCWGFDRSLFHWRSPVFIAASVISANAAYASIRIVPDRFAIFAIIITGAALLALSQKLVLEYSWTQMIVASVLAPGFFYSLLLVTGALPKDVERSVESYWPYFWQVGYLLGMFVIPDFFRKNSASSSL